MDRDKALELLKGGPEGIQEWNRLRKEGETIPSLARAELREANLNGADLSVAHLAGTVLLGADLENANLVDARCDGTIFGDTDLSRVKDLATIRHFGPSTVGVDTLRASKGNIPEEFLRGCGLTPWEIQVAKLYDPALTAEECNDIVYKVFAAHQSAVILGGVFISYARVDSPFVDKVYERLKREGASVWLDRHDMTAGPMQKQVDRGIRINDIVLLVLSAASVESDWVQHELKMAHKKEKEEGRDVLCPVALDNAWRSKRDDVFWEPAMKFNVLDFSQWESDAFERQFQKLLQGMKIYYGPASKPNSGR